MSQPTDEWTLDCTDCEFRGAASNEEVAERLADTHRSVTDHTMVVRSVGSPVPE